MNSKVCSAFWRPLTGKDISRAFELSKIIHPSFPEDYAVFEERLQLYPEGCKFLEERTTNEGLGYLLSHPWIENSAPLLNALLHNIPPFTSSYYIHDLALHPKTRGTGMAKSCILTLIENVKKKSFEEITLVSVNGSESFWRQQGFIRKNVPGLQDKLKSYGEDACYMSYII